MALQATGSAKEELCAIFRRVGEKDPRAMDELYAFQQRHPEVRCQNCWSCHLLRGLYSAHSVITDCEL